MATTSTQLSADARSATAVNKIEETVARLMTDASGAYCSPLAGAWFITELRANGYVIKCAVSPCGGYERDNNASSE